MNRKRAALVTLAAASSLVLVAACGSSGGSADTKNIDFSGTAKATLNAWAFNGADDVGKARIADVQKFLKGVDIKYDYTAFDSQKFTTRLASGNVPDVIQMDSTYVPTYAAQGIILPLDKCFSQNNVDPQQRFYKSIVDDVTYQGHIWGVPQFYQPNAIILNKDVMDAAGVTDDEIDTSKPDVLLAAIKKMYQSNGGVPNVMGFNAVPTGFYYQWVVGLGGQLVDSSGKPTLDDPSNVYPLQFLKKIADAQGGFAKDKSFTDSFDAFGDQNQFVKNQVGSEVDAQWYPNVLSPYKNQINIEAVPFNDKDGNPVSVTTDQAFVIPAKGSNPVAACDYALRLTAMQDWVAAEKARVQTLQKNGGVNTGLFTGSPEADKAIHSKYVKSSGNPGFDQVINTYYDVVGDGKTIGASPAGQAIQQALLNAITTTLLGQSSPQAALGQAQQQAMHAYDTVAN
ncbi:MAG TPA: extracellular solute-binding protein [Jatrophihabitans sp.]|nr:extracellular solute-binding protein [Jatrophihabitans sp.]